MLSANAYLKYSTKTFPLWVMGLEQAHELAGSLSQSKTYQHFYPKSYYPGAMTITGRVRDQSMYDDLADFIRGHQLALVNNPVLDSGLSGSLTNRPGRETLPLMEFGFPGENLILTGWVAPFTAGAKRFNVAPEYTLTFVIASDAHSTNERINASFTTRGWWTGAFLDFDEGGPVDTRKAPHSTPRDLNQYKMPDIPPDPPQISAAPIIVSVLSGGAFGNSGPGGNMGGWAPGGEPPAYKDKIAAGAPALSDPVAGNPIKAQFTGCIPPDPGKQYYGETKDEGRVFGVGHDQGGNLESNCKDLPPHIHIKYRNPPGAGNTVGVPV